MPRRGSRPSLYELGSNRLGRVQQMPESHADPENPQSPPTGRRRISLPTGYVVVGVVFALGVVLAAWWMGRTSGHEAQQADRASQLAMRVTADPLAQPAMSRPAVQPPLEKPQQTQRREGVSSPPEGASGGAEPASEASNDDQPLQKGLYYIVLAETRPSGAEALKSFCEANGLAVAFDPGHNARNVRVIALPGLASSDPNLPANQELAQRIKLVADRWLKSKREVIFHDTYYQRM